MPLLAIAALTFLWALADFPMGLWLSNHLPPFEGGLSPLGEVYGRIGAVAAAAAVVAQAVAVGRRRRSAALR